MNLKLPQQGLMLKLLISCHFRVMHILFNLPCILLEHVATGEGIMFDTPPIYSKSVRLILLNNTQAELIH